MRRRLFPGIPLLLLLFFVAFQDRAHTEFPSSTLPREGTMFLTARTFPVGKGASSVAVGDFNGDGKPDLVTANTDSGNVSVLLGKGNFDFQPAVNYAVGSFPSFVAVGDLNGDGKLDLAVANSGDDTVSVLLGNGDGTFQPAVNYSGGGTSLAVGDFNGDGKLDLVTAGGGAVSVLPGNGDGTFQSAVNYVDGSYPFSVAVGDFNRDGAPDLVALAGGAFGIGAVAVFLNTRGTVASLTNSPNPSSVGEEVTFTADVHRTVRGSQIVAGKMTGTVTFRDGTKTLGTVPWLSHINTFTTSSLSKGTHTITATYSGDSNYNPVTSPPLTQTVQ